ncbi:MAG: hypothetical protein M1821_006837 [Bathelium mastoideum]|nr:MAG: hypothetical protein M1821_006837 [Bathelium mastoideum]
MSEKIARATSLQADLGTWRLSIPRNPRTARPLGRMLSRFFEQGLSLVSSDPAIMQEAVTSLSSEGGLARIKELFELRLDDLPEERVATLFSSDFLPFFRTITHENVLSSNVLEKHVGTIYNCICGPGGHRALGIYNPLASMFLLMSGDELSDSTLHKLQPDIATCLEIAIAVLTKLIDINGSASLNEEFCPVVGVLAAALDDVEATGKAILPVQQAKRQLSRLQQRLGLVQSLPDAGTTLSGKPNKLPSFQIEVDGPGWLSKDGPRHDNDFEDITQISILPTSDEINASRQEYIPVTDPAQLHLGGIEGLLDRHFRLLREDTVGQLRNAIRLELENSSDSKGAKQAVRTFSYQNMDCLTMDFDQWKGLRFLVKFDQPASLQKLNKRTDAERREWWGNSKRLQTDSLVCILSADGHATFCTVVGSYELKNDADPEDDSGNQEDLGFLDETSEGLQSRYHQRGLGRIAQDLDFCGQEHQAYAVLRLVQHDEPNAKQLLDQFGAERSRDRSSLIEFPGVLLPAFRPTLQALQQMSKSLDIPFANVLAPSLHSNTDVVQSPPPVYATDRNFRFDLSSILQEDKNLALALRDRFDLDYFRQNTMLDEAQVSAVAEALSRDFALIQGPPGTGKSFTGVALIKVLLDNAKSGKIGPIICVCYTNHALDQLLEQLLAHEVTQIIRIGSRSKSEPLAPINLRRVMEQMTQTPQEKKAKAILAERLSTEADTIRELLEQLHQAGSVTSIKNYLLVHNPEQHSDLFGDEDEEGFTKVRRKDNVINDWLKNRHSRLAGLGKIALRDSNRPIADLCEAYLHGMSIGERQRLHQHWVSEITSLLQERFVEALLTYQETKEEFDHIKDDLKLRCLQQANVIGLTTTGLARNLSLLRKLRSKVLLCEEAGEVLEAHLLTALLPSIEHAILIGDPEQLRPQIQNHDLSLENPEGKKYSLNMSLFERLVQPQETSLGLHPSILETQRRMHPSISRLIRRTLYPMLKDAPVVEEYPEVKGMRRRLYWLDHNHPEAGKDETSGTSHTNEYEIEMVTSLVSHLVKQSVYTSNDIAVLTPYLGQLQKLRRSLASRFEIVLSERDTHDLEAAGMEEMPPESGAETSKTKLLNALRIATVDNFQGEEAKVVVISLVRSNPQNKCGFLKTSNRINVLLSRAQHGMYIIGNSRTCSGVKMWNSVLNLLRADENVGPTLELQCARHPDLIMNIAEADDFLRLAPEGGCTEILARNRRLAAIIHVRDVAENRAKTNAWSNSTI